MRISCIYTISNLIDGKIYVGRSKNFSTRKGVHLRELQDNLHKNIHLQRAVKKHSIENFIVEILEEYPKELLVALEHYWATILRTHERKYGYNILPTHPEKESTITSEIRSKAIIKNTGTKRTKQSVEKQLKTRKKNFEERGYYMSEETKAKMLLIHKGSIRPESARINMRKPKTFTEESKKRIIEYRTGKCFRELKKVSCLNIETREIKNYKSVKDIFEKLQISVTTIKGGIREKRIVNRKYIFIYSENYKDENSFNLEIKTAKKEVIQYDLNYNYIQTFSSLIEAQDKTGVKSCNITMCCQHHQGKHKYYKTAGNYIWNYKI